MAASKKQERKSAAKRRQEAKRKAEQILDAYRRRALTREDLQYELGLTAAEADAVYRYLTKSERGYKEEFISEESGTHLWVPVNSEGIRDALLGVGKAVNPPALTWSTVHEGRTADLVRILVPAGYLNEDEIEGGEDYEWIDVEGYDITLRDDGYRVYRVAGQESGGEVYGAGEEVAVGVTTMDEAKALAEQNLQELVEQTARLEPEWYAAHDERGRRLKRKLLR